MNDDISGPQAGAVEDTAVKQTAGDVDSIFRRVKPFDFRNASVRKSCRFRAVP